MVIESNKPRSGVVFHIAPAVRFHVNVCTISESLSTSCFFFFSFKMMISVVMLHLFVCIYISSVHILDRVQHPAQGLIEARYAWCIMQINPSCRLFLLTVTVRTGVSHLFLSY